MPGNIKWVSLFYRLPRVRVEVPVASNTHLSAYMACMTILYRHARTWSRSNVGEHQMGQSGSVCFTGYQGVGLGFRLLQTHS
jgi:hypothetical protein